MNAVVENSNPVTRNRETSEVKWLVPCVNVCETREDYVVQAEMPGVNREGLEITVEDHTLTLTGRRAAPVTTGTPLYVESKPAGFRRVFELDPMVDTSKIAAKLEQGLLTVLLPKAEQVKPRQIPVS